MSDAKKKENIIFLSCHSDHESKLKQNQHIQTCEWTELDLECQKFWRDLSCEYAKKAKGDIRFALGPGVKPNSTWIQVERGQIKANQEGGQDVYDLKKYDLHLIYCEQMKNHPTEFPIVKKEICG